MQLFYGFLNKYKRLYQPKETVNMNINSVLVFSIIVLMTFSGSSYSETSKKFDSSGELVSYQVGKRIDFHSNVLTEERQLLIHLPKDYEESNQKYPVIYMLDGNGHFKHATIAVDDLQSRGMMPKAIIVGITNNSATRNRDLGEGSDKFWRYIQDEVITYVEKSYRTSSHKTLFGHSMAGAFVLDGLLDNISLFNGYIVASPGIGLDTYQRFNEYFQQSTKKINLVEGHTLFYSMAGISAELRETVLAATKLSDLFKDKAPNNFNWKYLPLPQLAHMTTPVVTFYQGINQVFRDFQPPSYDSYQEFVDGGRMEGIKQHYLKRSVKYQVTQEIPNDFIRRLGRPFFRDGHKGEAIALLTENTKNFPESIWAHNSLARLYDQNGQLELSISNFEIGKKLAIKHKNEYAIEYLTSEIKRVSEER